MNKQQKKVVTMSVFIREQMQVLAEKIDDLNDPELDLSLDRLENLISSMKHLNREIKCQLERSNEKECQS